MDRAEVSQKLTHAIQKLTERDLELLARDVNERSITHRLAIYLHEEFPEMHVDCEYNRHDFEAKSLEFYPDETTTHDTDARTVFPDIIVHERGPEGPNVLVIEAKKSTNKDGFDIEKLKAYKSNEHTSTLFSWCSALEIIPAQNHRGLSRRNRLHLSGR